MSLADLMNAVVVTAALCPLRAVSTMVPFGLNRFDFNEQYMPQWTRFIAVRECETYLEKFTYLL